MRAAHMTLEPLALVLVLLSALMHAGWNLIAKIGGDRLVAMAVMKVPNMLAALLVLAFVGVPGRESWPFLIVSTCVNCMYFFFLIRAYRGDLSLAYPVARGVAPLLVLVLSAVSAHEMPTPVGVAGVLLISAAVLALAARRNGSRLHYETLVWAGGVGLTIALYTVIDGLGARRSGNVIGYVAILNVLTGIAVCGTAYARRGHALIAAGLRAYWRQGMVGGVLMLFAYMIVVYALTIAPMAQIAALRESSVIFAAILGVIVLREPFGRRRIAASVILDSGIALLALGR
jgi:drug/metabolite transporter (DMT)-like permease